MDQKELWKRIDEESDIIANDVFMKTGIAFRKVSQLVNENMEYTEAIPVLAEHLYRDYTRNTMDMLVRSLIHPKSKGVAATALFDLLAKQSPEDENMRNVIGSALVYAVEEKDYDQLFTIAADKTCTASVFNIVRALAKLKSNRDKTAELIYEVLGQRNIEFSNKRLIILDSLRSLKSMKKKLPSAIAEKYSGYKDSQVQKALAAVSG